MFSGELFSLKTVFKCLTIGGICCIILSNNIIVFCHKYGRNLHEKNFDKRIGAVLTAIALSSGVCYTLPNNAMADDAIFESECESLTIDGAEVATKVYNDEYPGYTGEGFVWVTSGGTMTFKVDAPKTGMYRLVSRCIMYLGDEVKHVKLL